MNKDIKMISSGNRRRAPTASSVAVLWHTVSSLVALLVGDTLHLK